MFGRKIIGRQKRLLSESEKTIMQQTTGRQMLFTKDNWEKDVHAKDYLATKEAMGLAVGVSLLSFIQAELNVMSCHLGFTLRYACLRFESCHLGFLTSGYI